MVNMVKIGWPFDIPAKSSRPADSSVQTGYSDEFVFSPKPFQADFVLRSPKHKEVILQEYEAAKTVFARYED